ncbi:hypothetical protein SDC9_20880 [bioreactor metagenome]|uniref:Single-stranded DNA-binding protein n=1 Tax=bioreactor metagenome TaxID=1076179 RepID=A0A644U7Z9_9ZZZZ|nr:ERF family protein [Negativicutes bacterium]
MQKLASKLVQVMKEVAYVEKRGSNDFHHYAYATSADVLGKINAAMTKHNIASVAIPEVLSVVDVITAKGSTEHLATVKMDIMLVDAESGETVTITGLGSGQDIGDKAVMKAQTAAIKYAYLLSMAIATGDDPEADRTTDEAADAKNILAHGKTETRKTKSSEFTCVVCQATISDKIKTYSESKFGRALCMDCQKRKNCVA